MADTAPDEIERLAAQRADARRARDWEAADRLRASIEAAGWKVVDSGTDYRLEPACPPDVVVDGRTYHGSTATVAPRWDGPAVAAASVVVAATGDGAALERALRSLAAHAPPRTHVVIVAADPSRGASGALGASGELPTVAGTGPEVVWLAGQPTHGAMLEAGARRAAGGVVIWMDAGVELTGDALTPVVTALDDPAVALAGGFGLTSADIRRFVDAPAGEVDALGPRWLAYRRDDHRDRGPLDERFHSPPSLGVWWSLVLRDSGAGTTPRSALALDLPLTAHEDLAGAALDEGDAARRAKRDFYRILDRFGGRTDLLLRPVPSGSRSGARERAGG